MHFGAGKVLLSAPSIVQKCAPIYKLKEEGKNMAWNFYVMQLNKIERAFLESLLWMHSSMITVVEFQSGAGGIQ